MNDRNGVQPVADRQSWAPWVEIDATTSGITSIGTGGTARLRYRRQGSSASLRVRINFGTGGGGGAGTWGVLLPSGWTTVNETNDYQYGDLMANNGTAIDCRMYANPNGTSLLFQALDVAGTYPTWTALNGTVPFTFASGHFLVGRIDLELAT